MNTCTRRASALVVLATGLAVSSAWGGIASSVFDQLSWYGLEASQPLSPWGRVTIGFARQPDLQYLNLSILRPGDAAPTWVVRNLGIASLLGGGIDTVSTTFDLGIAAPGELVSRFDYGITLGAAMDDGPAIDAFDAGVNQVDYRIGGMGEEETGNPGRPPPPAAGNKDKPIIDSRLPGRERVVNQPQTTNECAPAAVSNSLNYLIATGKASEEMPSTKEYWSGVFDREPGKTTPLGCEAKKKAYFEANPEWKIKVEIVEGGLTKENLEKIAKAVREGKDVEIKVGGHMAMVVGVRVYADGRVEMDFYDDDQDDTKADPMRVVRGTVDGTLDGEKVWRFVTEIPSPSTATVFLATAGILVMGLRRR